MADNDIIVCMGASRINGLMPEYHAQLEAAGIPYHAESTGMTSPNDGVMGMWIRWLQTWALRFSAFKRIVVTDAWDVQFYGSKEEIVDKIPDDKVILAAERNCYPDPSLAAESRLPTPWKFVNGGMLCGTPQMLLNWTAKLLNHPKFEERALNQAWLNQRLAERSPLVHVDYMTRRFYCLFREHEGNELRFVDGKPWNSLCDTRPQFVHLNGSYPVAELRRIQEAGS